MALQVDLDGHQQELIRDLVAEGVYSNASEAIADGLRRIEAERVATAEAVALRRAAQEGFADFDTGDFVAVSSDDDHRAVWAQIQGQVAARREARGTTTS